MTEEDPGDEATRELAEEAMTDKSDARDSDEARELWDVPTESAGTLARQQDEGE